jgi:hypothetical protein
VFRWNMRDKGSFDQAGGGNRSLLTFGVISFVPYRSVGQKHGLTGDVQ